MQMCGIALVCIGLWMHIRHERLFYGVLLLDNPTSPFLFLRRLSLIVIGVGSVLTVMCFVGGCGAATECICFLVSVRQLHIFHIMLHRKTKGLLFFPFNPLRRTGSYIATSNAMKLVHWPLMGGLLHFVQRARDSAGPQPAQAPPRCTKCDSPPINGQCTNHRIDV